MSFIDPSDFPFLKPLSDNWEIIRSEYDAVSGQIIPWPETIHNGKWSVIGLKFQDRELPLNKLAPVTTKLCEEIPGISTYGFSIMHPGCIIHPHTGHSNSVLRCHLGLYTNPESTITVEKQTYSWKEGELMIFNDMLLHSTYNKGTVDRVVLLLDFYRPGIESPPSDYFQPSIYEIAIKDA